MRPLFHSAVALLAWSPSSLAAYLAFLASNGPYASGPASNALPWPGEDFQSYEDGAILECSKDKTVAAHLDVTAGCLKAKHAGSCRRGWTDDAVFRAVAIGRDADGRRVQWTDQGIEYRAYVKDWHRNGSIPAWSGLHAFARYRSSDDLYVASIRYDGRATIKMKWDGVYTTLAQTQLTNELGDYLDENGKLRAGKWYKLKFTAIALDLKLYLDGKLLLSASNETIRSGTIGIRKDYSSTYLDDWKLTY